MKIRVYLKDPDGFSDGLKDSVEKELKAVPGLSDRERELLFEARRDLAGEVLGRWVEYGEYVWLEFDTEAKTATVLTKEDAA